MLDLFRNIFAPPRDMILLVAAIWIGLWLAEKRSEKHEISVAHLNNLTFYPLISFIIGGRLLFAAENLSAFTQNPQSLISLNMDLFDPLGGAVIAAFTALVYGQRNKLSIWSALDALTPFFAVFALGLGLANLASGSAFGKETSLPWGIELWSATRHPSQVYEILASLLILGLLRFQKTDLRPGLHFLTFAALTSGARLFLETFRGDSTLIFGGLRLAQVVSWLVLTICLILIDQKFKNPTQELVTRNNG